MADAPRLFGVPMLPASDDGLRWCKSGVWLDFVLGRWKWEIDLESSEIMTGNATRRRDACHQIERAITRIRNAAAKLGT